MPSRRDALALTGGALVGLAGCAGDGTRTGTADDGTAADTVTTADAASDYGTDSPTATEAPETGVDVSGAELDWERSLGDTPLAGPLLLDGRVVVATGTTVRAFDAASGAPAWTVETGVMVDADYGRPTAELAVHDGTLYALVGVSVGTGAHDHVLLALAPDGTRLWRAATGVAGFHHLVGFGGGAVVIGTSDDAVGGTGAEHAVLAYDLADGARLWSAESGDAHGGTVRDGAVLLEAYGLVDCLDLADGTRRFRYDAPDTGEVTAAALGGGHVYVAFDRSDPAADERTMLALDATDGSESWGLTGSVVTSLRYRGDLYVGGERVARYGPDGTRRWRSDGGGLVTGVPFDAEALYTNADERVVSLARETGAERWATPASDLAIPRGRGGETVVSVDGRARAAFAHATGDGRERWRASYPGEYPPEPAVGPEASYLATAAGGLVRVPH